MTISKPREGLWNIGQPPGAAGPEVEMGVCVYRHHPARLTMRLSSGNQGFNIDLYTAKLLLELLPDAVAKLAGKGGGES